MALSPSFIPSVARPFLPSLSEVSKNYALSRASVRERIRPYVRPPSWDVDRYDTEGALNVQFLRKQKMSFSALGRSVKIEEDGAKIRVLLSG